jgi:hypothetical protein
MARMLKNRVFKSASYALAFPKGSSSVGPDAPVSGQARYNTTTGKLEFYNNETWNAVAREGFSLMSKDSFTGDGTSTEYGPMSYPYPEGSEAYALVHVGTVYQIPGTNYTFDGTNKIKFTSPPSDGADITIIHGISSTIVG